jgi:hypothetical protein
MKTDYCQFGNCKRAQKVVIAMTNLTTKETSKTKVCGDHTASVLDACDRNNLYAEMTVIR